MKLKDMLITIKINKIRLNEKFKIILNKIKVNADSLRSSSLESYINQT